ncbi:hypothetical protein EG244_17260 [Falsigemmobacter faecalis]|uniref:Transposase n=1 Tax=Falsigemmobacter faecalis TaxID=2488730 RepID=A0A3P3D735_9RHOB|nr:hypothetical protein EG244_17260 [Falsigemmobacter faecalis]
MSRPWLEDGASLSVAARRTGVAPNLFDRWRWLIFKGVSVAVSEEGEISSNRVARQLEEPVRELKRQLGPKTLDAKTCAGRWTSHG